MQLLIPVWNTCFRHQGTHIVVIHSTERAGNYKQSYDMHLNMGWSNVKCESVVLNGHTIQKGWTYYNSYLLNDSLHMNIFGLHLSWPTRFTNLTMRQKYIQQCPYCEKNVTKWRIVGFEAATLGICAAGILDIPWVYRYHSTSQEICS